MCVEVSACLLLIVLGYRYPSVSMTLTERAAIRLNDGYLTCIEYGEYTQNADSVQDVAVQMPGSWFRTIDPDVIAREPRLSLKNQGSFIPRLVVRQRGSGLNQETREWFICLHILDSLAYLFKLRKRSQRILNQVRESAEAPRYSRYDQLSGSVEVGSANAAAHSSRR